MSGIQAQTPFLGSVQAGAPTSVIGGVARVSTAYVTLETNGGSTTTLIVYPPAGWSIIAVFCHVMKPVDNPSPVYGQVSISGQSVTVAGDSATCVWQNNGGGGALGSVSADVSLVSKSGSGK